MIEALPDPDAEQRRAADPAASAWVAASAGTGKTKVLTDRVLALMLTGTRPERILCLTFTKAAAAEMANRLSEILGHWATDADVDLDRHLDRLLGRPPKELERRRARRLFARVLDTPGSMRIETIHAFCQSLLRRFPLEAGIQPHFAVMDDRDAAELLKDAREEVLTRSRDAADPALAAALRQVTARVHETGFTALMEDLAKERGRLTRLLDRPGGVEAVAFALGRRLGLEPADDPRSVVADACDDDAFDALGLRLAVKALEQGSEPDRGRALIIAAWLAVPKEERIRTFPDYRGVFLTQKDQIKALRNLITKAAVNAVAGADEIMLNEAARMAGVAEKVRAAVTREATLGLLRLGDALLAAYRHHKEARAAMDYDDLILAARRLLEGEGNAAWVLYKLDQGIEHVLIDEAQDTNPDQWRVVEILADEFFAGRGTRDDVPRTLFAVGDVKQSIYSFQRADPDMFREMRERFADRVAAAGAEWRTVDLDISFRSAPAVLRAVDAVFARPEAADGVALDGRAIRHAAFRAGDAGCVEVWPPVEARETDDEPSWKPPVERFPGDSPEARLARLVAGRIREMVGGAEILESRGRPIQAGDVMVLVRRRTAFVEELVRALKGRGVAVAGVDRMVLKNQLAVMDLIALGRFVLLPEDDLTLAAVLKGPLIGLGEEDLFRLAWKREGTLWEALRGQAGNDPAFARAVGELRELLALADHVPPFEFYARVLGPMMGRKKIVSRLGADALDPLAEFLDLTLAFERTHVPSLEGFLHWVEAGGVEIKRDLEQARIDAVRVMTVHGAKGLQAPIVFLPDTLQVPTRIPKLLWIGGEEGELLLWPPREEFRDAVARAEIERIKKRRDQEYRRLLYVAMTRAEDRLYVCGWSGRRPEDCWYHLIKAGLAGIAQEIEDPFLAKAGETSESRVLRLASRQERAPGIAFFRMPEEVSGGLPGWALGPPPPEPEPPRPLVPSREGEDEPPVRSPLGDDGGVRFRRGRLIHRLLQSLPDLPPDARPGAARAFLAQPGHRLDAGQQAGIVAETLAVLEHPDLAPLFGPESQAEVAIAGLVGGRAISAQVDRLWVGPEQVLVIDYKTNRPSPREPGEVPTLYLRQMAAYREALRAIYPEKAVRCLLLWTDGPRLMELDDALLDPACVFER